MPNCGKPASANKTSETMARQELTRSSTHSARQIFDMVADVGRYNEFVPLCRSARIYDRTELGEGHYTFKAALEVAKESLNIRETFVSDVEVNENDLTVISRARGGPVKHLVNRWSFTDLPAGGCANKIALEYEMANLPLRLLMRASFDIAMSKVIEAFETRADELYGPK